MRSKLLSEIEEYKDEDKYMVFENGDIVSYKYKQPRVLKGSLTKDGYIAIKLTNGRSARAHRIVAMAFISNPNNLPEVNHIDGNKRNNSVENLEWVSRQENMTHAKETGLLDPSKWSSGADNYQYDKPTPNNKCVAMYDLDGNYLNSFYSLSSACRYINVNTQQASWISKSINHYSGKAFKYQWRFIESIHVQRLSKHNIDELDSILNGVEYTTS